MVGKGEGTRRRNGLGISWERTIFHVLQHLKSSPRPWAQGAAWWAGLGVCPAPPTSTTGWFFPLGSNQRQHKPCCPRSTVGCGALAGAGSSCKAGRNGSFFARFPAKSASAGGCELSSSEEPDSAPKPQFSLKPRSHPPQHTFTARSCTAPRLLPALMGNNIYFHQQRHI